MRNSRFRDIAIRLALLISAAFAIAPSLTAQEKFPRIRRIYVPADAPESWPEGSWTPIPAARLAIAERRSANETQSGSWVRHARYTALFREGSLQSGKCELEIESPAQTVEGDASLLSWGNSNIAFTNLRWQEQAARLGTSLENETFLLVPRGHQHLLGEWSFRGRPLAYGFQYRLQLPPAAVSELTLSLPRAAEFRTFDQTQWEWLDPPETEPRRVRLNAGSRTVVNFAVLNFGDSSPTLTAPTLFTHAETLVVLSRDQSRIRQELRIEALEAPLTDVTFELPNGVEIREVELGGRLLKDWSLTGNQKQFLKVNFPEPLVGLSRPLRLTGLLIHPPAELWRLPHILPRNSDSLSERVTINVTPPWELLTVKEEGYRQTAAATTPDGSGSLIFEAIAPQGTIDIRIGLPPVRVRAEIATQINELNHHRTAICELTGKVSLGRLYVFTMELAERWIPTSIGLHVGSDGELFSGLHWWISESDNQRLLHVELPHAISRDQSLELQMNFEEFPSATSPPSIPVVRTQSEVPSDQLIALPRELITANPRAGVLTGWSRIDPEDAPEWLQRSNFGQSLKLNSNRWSLFSSRSPAFQQLPDASPGMLFSVRAEDRLTIEKNETAETVATELLSLHLNDISKPVSNLSFTTGSDAALNLWNWNVADRPEIEVQCRRQTRPKGDSVTQHHWELAFVPPLTDTSCLITAQQQSSGHDEWVAVLPLVQNAHQNSGRVLVENRLSLEDGASLQLTSVALEQALPGSLAPQHELESVYMQPGASLQIQLNQDQPAGPQIETHLAWDTLFTSSEADELLHDIKIPLPAEVTHVTGSWPDSIDPPQAWINDIPVPVSLDQSGKFEIRWDASPDLKILELEFLSPVKWSHNEYHWAIPLPQFDLDIQYCQWNVRVPPDCRVSQYSDPLSLIRSNVSSATHWTRRLFGPLGRRTQQEFFQPLNRSEWRALLEADAPVNADPPVERLPADAAEIPGCQFRMLNWPEQVTLDGLSEARQERDAWACFFLALFVGVLIRIARWESRSRLAAWSLALLGLIAWTVPEEYSIFAGAIFAAAVTATLIPRVLLLGQRAASQDSEIRMIEGSTLKGMMVRLLVVGLSLSAAGQITAQTAPRPEPRKPESPRTNTIDVLIPFSGSAPPRDLPGFVYIRAADRQLPIFQESAAKRPVLFTSADYFCRLSEREIPTIRVRMQVEIPASQAIQQLTIPLTGANLAREGACFVDGKPAPVAITPQGLLEIGLPQRFSSPAEPTDASTPLRAPRPDAPNEPAVPESRQVSLELNLYPPASVQGVVQQWELNIPAISNSRFRCEYPATSWPVPRLTGSRGEVSLLQNGLITAELGKTDRIVCQWTEARFPPTDMRERAQIEIRPVMAIELLPTHLRYRVRTINRVRQGRVDYLSWKVPKSFRLHKVFSDDIVLQTHEVLNPNVKQIMFDLSETLTPQSDPETIIEAEFIVPLQPGREEEISVAVPDLLATDSDLQPVLDVTGFETVVELWSPPELPLSMLETSAADIHPLNIKEYRSQWAEDASLPIPEHVYELQPPGTLTFLRTSTQPQKTAVLVQETGTIGDQYLEWEWNAEVKTTRLPAFQHVFQIDDPNLEILSVNVQEDQAERVHRWSREGSTLTVRLTRKTEENSQDITIRGRLPLKAEQEVVLPEIRLANAEREDSRVDLYLSPHRTARWISELTPSAAVTSPSTAKPNRGELTLFDTFTRRSDDSQPRVVLIGRKTPPPHFERAITIRRRADGDFDFSVLLTEQSSSMREGSLQVKIPQAWALRLRPLASIGDTVPQRETLPEGDELLTIPPEARSFPLVLQTTLSAPQEEEASTWNVPWPSLNGEATYHNLVSLRLSDGWAPHIDCRIDPADDTQFVNNPSDAERWEYLCDTLELQRSELSDPEAVPTVMHMLATVHLHPGAFPHGQWWILYRGRGEESISLESPIGLRQVTGEINSRTVDLEYDAESRVVTVPLLPGEDWQSCILNWTAETPFPKEIVSDFSLQMPKVTELEVRESRAILLTDPDLKVALHHELNPESALVIRMKILETFQQMLESGELQSGEIPDGLKLLLAALLAPADSAARPDGQPVRTETSLHQTRLEELQKELREQLSESRIALPVEELKSSTLSKELTVWESLLPGIVPDSQRPDREVLYYSIPESPKESKIWWMSRLLYHTGVALLIAIILIPVSVKLFQSRSANWAVRHRPVMWLLIGIIWWTCLQLSVVGLTISAFALIALGWQSFAPKSVRL